MSIFWLVVWFSLAQLGYKLVVVAEFGHSIRHYMGYNVKYYGRTALGEREPVFNEHVGNETCYKSSRKKTAYNLVRAP